MFVNPNRMRGLGFGAPLIPAQMAFEAPEALRSAITAARGAPRDAVGAAAVMTAQARQNAANAAAAFQRCRVDAEKQRDNAKAYFERQRFFALIDNDVNAALKDMGNNELTKGKYYDIKRRAQVRHRSVLTNPRWAQIRAGFDQLAAKIGES